MKILILGGDGYLGWPTSIYLSAQGHDVMVADNYAKRRLFLEENVKPLFDVPNLHDRVTFWEENSGHAIKVRIGDLTHPEIMSEILLDFLPEAIVHFAEQPSAPYSMRNQRSAAYTLNNNLNTTLNLIFAVKKHCPEAHIVKLGTMGEYGTPNIDIEEGWIDIEHHGRKDTFLYPRQAGSLYHTTKIMDTDLLWFYVRTWGLKVTDLMQGPVYGLFTDETGRDVNLLPFFSYDEIFGTVLNRFIVQAAIGHPLTVYGEGGQTRGYLNIKDTLNCIRLAIENPPDVSKMNIYNQVTETFTVNELAGKIKIAGDQLGLNVNIQSVENPRKEMESHYYNPKYTALRDLGLDPHYLTNDVLAELIKFVKTYENQIDRDQIFRGISWA